MVERKEERMVEGKEERMVERKGGEVRREW